MGNRRSVEKALEHVGADVASISSDPDEIARGRRARRAGVGAFPRAMATCARSALTTSDRGRPAGEPLLGICLGMQFLFERSIELEPARASGVARRGRARSTPAPGMPHIGWNEVRWERASRATGPRPRRAFYLVHSFMPVPGAIGATCSARPSTASGSRAVARDTCSASSSTGEVLKRGAALLGNFVRAALRIGGALAAHEPLPGDRHPRRPGGAPAPGRLRRARPSTTPIRSTRAAWSGRRARAARRRPRRGARRRAREPRRSASDHARAAAAGAARRRAARSLERSRRRSAPARNASSAPPRTPRLGVMPPSSKSAATVQVWFAPCGFGGSHAGRRIHADLVDHGSPSNDFVMFLRRFRGSSISHAGRWRAAVASLDTLRSLGDYPEKRGGVLLWRWASGFAASALDNTRLLFATARSMNRYFLT